MSDLENQNENETKAPVEDKVEVSIEAKVNAPIEVQVEASVEAQDETPREAELGSHGHKTRERKDIASGEVMDPSRMIRLAVGPDGEIVADIFGKIPGRGLWVAANRDAVQTAIKNKAFGRAAKRKVILPENFADMIEAQLKKRVLGLVGMANRAGALEAGFDKARSLVQNDQAAIRFEALDGAEDGRSKIRVIAKAIAKEIDRPCPPAIGCFDGYALGQILGREHVVHLVIKRGKLAKALKAELSRLSGFCVFIPHEWPDKEHEEPFEPFS